MEDGLTKEFLKSLVGRVTDLEEEYDKQQSAAAERLRSICELKGRAVYVRGDFKGLEELENEGVAVRQAFAKKLMNLIEDEEECAWDAIRLMEQLVLSVRKESEEIRKLQGITPPRYPVPSVVASTSELIDTLENFADTYTYDLTAKTTVLRDVVNDSKERNEMSADQMQHHMLAFTCQGYIPRNTISLLKSTIESVMLVL
eukprot:TRINITY_DN6757_c0_g1_i1.p2 TRINITY_DN6757_c0_g1~~TRINITY_DN6757_c0_g1_i1.p2  ORF type:complete len:201 (+),score=56.74 TRINITY_DN6757_c0_g1_i1:765-1367(+)